METVLHRVGEELLAPEAVHTAEAVSVWVGPALPAPLLHLPHVPG